MLARRRPVALSDVLTTDLPAAIVFDLDGTIVDTETIEFESIRDVWAEHGQPYTLAQFEHVIGGTGGPPWVDELANVLGTTLDHTTLIARRREIQAEMLIRMTPRDGVVALIEEASAAGVPLAIASNSPLYWIESRLAAADVAHHFSVLVAIDTASRPKPDPAPYLEACAALGADPLDSIAFEDSIVGVMSARAAGLYTIACAGPLTTGHDLSAANRVIASHAEISLADLSRTGRR